MMSRVEGGRWRRRRGGVRVAGQGVRRVTRSGQTGVGVGRWTRRSPLMDDEEVEVEVDERPSTSLLHITR